TNRLEFFDAESGLPAGRTLETTEFVQNVAITGDSQRVAAGVPGKTLHLWNLGTNPPVRQLLPHREEVRLFAFSHDGRRLTTITLHDLTVWDLESGEPAWAPIQPGGDLMDCRITLDDRNVATASWDTHARVFD